MRLVATNNLPKTPTVFSYTVRKRTTIARGLRRRSWELWPFMWQCGLQDN